MKYSEIRAELKTGDVVLFRGKGRISRWIRWFCSLCNFFKKTWASHIGVIIVDSSRIMLFESTSIRGGHKGVRLVPLSEAVEQYEGEIIIRQLRCVRCHIFRVTAEQVVQSQLGKKYEKNLRELMSSAYNGLILGHNKTENMDSVFCSELVAYLFKQWKFLPERPPSNEYTPEDFRLGGRVDKYLRCNSEPVCLGTEIEIEK